MRRLLVAAMFVIFASLNAIDGICCPDGCTHGPQSPSQQHNPEQTGGICVLCLGGVDSSARQALLPSNSITDLDSIQLAPGDLPRRIRRDGESHPAARSTVAQ